MSMAISSLDRPSLDRLRRRALTVGAVGLIVCAAGLLLGPAFSLRAYHVAYQYFLGIALGSLALLMLQYLTGGVWGVVLRPYLDAAVCTLPLLAVLSLPLLLGLAYLFPWVSSPSPHNQWYLNIPFFLARAVGYFAIWLLLGHLLSRWAAPDGHLSSLALPQRFSAVSAAGLVLYGLTVTFAAIDWVMSLEPDWISTIYPVIFAVGQVLAGLALAIAVLCASLPRHVPANHGEHSPLRDLGSLLLTFVMLWAYMSFSQYLLIWSGNLPEEIVWYLRRTGGGWRWMALLLIVCHFGLPFLLLLSREIKQNPRALALIAGLILLMHYLDVLWWIEPAPYVPAASSGAGTLVGAWFWQPLQTIARMVLHVAALLGVAGIWIWAFLGQLQRRPPPAYETSVATAHATAAGATSHE